MLSGWGSDDRERKYSINRSGDRTEDYTIDHSPAFYTIMQIYAEKYRNTSTPPYEMARSDMDKEYIEYIDEI
ncbi:MAG: hypothetical protein EOP34_11775, partial [Rickettsiales bacterium]